jgi:hypothetical protein
MKDRMENIRSSSTDPNICIIAIFASLNFFGMNALKCSKLPMFALAMSKD